MSQRRSPDTTSRSPTGIPHIWAALLTLALTCCGEATEPEENPPAPPATVGSASYRATGVEGSQWTRLDPGGASTYEGWIIAVESAECVPGETGVDTLIVTNGTTLEMSIDGHFILSLLTASACSAGVQHLPAVSVWPS